ncbi:hypothetical protein DNU06_13575 [Putridiphycobacter roseus]|uniref:D-alanyl-lipoteichoic acid biosynthesis protein DltD n=1 Tax=Putridiphycobacter roseus TaxID=2219161 RepID=A0A2W1NP03_9FLAO|nr:D-alanyl-lipoteichoic acid biosynthesis protein DltD [Putridiphycobacter roseus]PZE16338.1 hypothetical protein DNU06_13575 [Putridiphycobacter roseus]
MLKKFSFFHLLPFLLAMTIAGVFIYLKKPIQVADKENYIVGNQTKNSGRYSNLLTGKDAEIDYFASLMNKNQFTLFGSSEFSESAYCSYNYFPDKLGLPMLGLGHAYHQNLSILIELLAADALLDSTSNICILLSPGWFTTGGTNSEAFIEFARPNLLSKIIHNTNISEDYKLYIGKFIDGKKNEFENFSPQMSQLQDQYLIKNANYLNKQKTILKNEIESKFATYKYVPEIDYKIKLLPNTQTTSIAYYKNFDSIGKALKNQFIAAITTNDIFVYDEYYTKYLVKDNEAYELKTLANVYIHDNPELNDLSLLIKYIKSKNLQASFVMIPFNAYCYNNVAVNEPLIDTITQLMNQNSLPFLNLYATTKEAYEPGLLKDVMHLSDFGWMKVNHFIYDLYYAKK